MLTYYDVRLADSNDRGALSALPVIIEGFPLQKACPAFFHTVMDRAAISDLDRTTSYQPQKVKVI